MYPQSSLNTSTLHCLRLVLCLHNSRRHLLICLYICLSQVYFGPLRPGILVSQYFVQCLIFSEYSISGCWMNEETLSATCQRKGLPWPHTPCCSAFISWDPAGQRRPEHQDLVWSNFMDLGPRNREIKNNINERKRERKAEKEGGRPSYWLSVLNTQLPAERCFLSFLAAKRKIIQNDIRPPKC